MMTIQTTTLQNYLYLINVMRYSNNKILRLCFVILFAFNLTLYSTQTFAQRDTIPSRKITTTANMLALGHINVLDDYISNEKYTGAELRFISMTDKFDPSQKISFQRLFQVSAGMPHNRAQNADHLIGMLNYSLGWHYNMLLLENKLRLQLGGLASLNFGGIYNTRSGNNCGQLKAYFDIDPSVIATYDFQMWKHNFTLRYSFDMPIFGLMFSPNYGQSYYEIFSEGQSDHNIVVTSLGNAPSFRQMLSLDFPIKTITFRIGYLGDFQQAHVNGIKTHIWTNSVMFGLVKRFKLSKIR